MKLLGHPLVGASWEGFVIENIFVQLPDHWQFSYYRSTAKAEIDLILEGPHKQVLAIEIKRSSAPKLSKGFYYACEEINATGKYVIYPGKEAFPLRNGVEAINLESFLHRNH